MTGLKRTHYYYMVKTCPNSTELVIMAWIFTRSGIVFVDLWHWDKNPKIDYKKLAIRGIGKSKNHRVKSSKFVSKHISISPL